MNLRALANSVTTAINPNIIGSVQISTGNTVALDGSTTPTYALYQGIPMQVQAASGPSLALVDNLNIQGIVREVFMNGIVEGLDRRLGKGGDVLTFNGAAWIVAAVIEAWDTGGWVRVLVNQQVGA